MRLWTRQWCSQLWKTQLLNRAETLEYIHVHLKRKNEDDIHSENQSETYVMVLESLRPVIAPQPVNGGGRAGNVSLKLMA